LKNGPPVIALNPSKRHLTCGSASTFKQLPSSVPVPQQRILKEPQAPEDRTCRNQRRRDCKFGKQEPLDGMGIHRFGRKDSAGTQCQIDGQAGRYDEIRAGGSAIADG